MIARHTDLTPECGASVGKTEWPNKRGGIYFHTKDFRSLSFLGIWNDIHEIRTMNIETIIDGKYPNGDHLSAQGRCELDPTANSISCSAKTDQGDFEGALNITN